MTIPKRVAVTEVSHWHSVYDASYLRILRDLGCDIVGVSDRFARIAGERAEHFGGTERPSRSASRSNPNAS